MLLNQVFVIVLLSLAVDLPIITCGMYKEKVQMKMIVASKTLHVKHFKSGIATDKLPDSVYYNKYIPLIFRLPVPQWSAETLRLNESLKCPSDVVTSKTNEACAVAFHLDQMLGTIANSISFDWKFYDANEGSSYFGTFSCDFIEPHFFRFATHYDQLQSYVDKIRSQCPLTRSASVINKNLSYTSVHHVSIASTRFNENSKNKNPIAEMAGYVALQTAKILTKYIDTVRWNAAFTQCQNSRLSIGLINSFLLKVSLKSIQSFADASGYKLSVPMHEYLSQYYKLPLTDCVLGVQHGKKTELLLRMLIPVQKENTVYSRYRLTKIPYLITTRNRRKMLCELANFESDSEFLMEETLHTTGTEPVLSYVPEDCNEGELCFVSEHPRNTVVDPCIHGLFNGSHNHIRDYCSFECYEIDNEYIQLPIIIKVSSNHFTITGNHPNQTINVYCGGKRSRELEPSVTNGLMQVILPCDCEIRFKTEIYRPTAPCDDQFQSHFLYSFPVAYGSAFHKLFEAKQEEPKPGSVEEEIKPDVNVPLLDVEDPSSVNDTNEVPASWILPVEEARQETDTVEVPSPRPKQFTLIWIFIAILFVINVLLFYVVHVNGLINAVRIRKLMVGRERGNSTSDITGTNNQGQGTPTIVSTFRNRRSDPIPDTWPYGNTSL